MKVETIAQRVSHWQLLREHVPMLFFVFALILRIGLIFALQTYSSPYHYSEHVRIARNILAGKGYSYGWYGLGSAGEGSFMPPLYVGIVLMANIAFPAAPWLAIQIYQALLSACTAMSIYMIGRETFTERVGAIASLLVALYPPSLGYVLDIQSLTLEAFLVSLTVLVCVYWQKRGARRYAFALGFSLGLTVLARSNLVLLLPLLLAWMILCHRRRGAVQFLVMVSVFVLTVGPWVLRNYLVHREFVFVSTKGGFTMYQGNNMHATGSSHRHLGGIWEVYPRLARELAPLGEAARDKRLYQESFAFMRTYPKKALLLAIKKLYYFWWFTPEYMDKGKTSGYPWYYGFVYQGSYATLVPFSILGLILGFKKLRTLFILYALFVVQAFVSMLFIAGTRFRGILEPLMITLASYGLVWAYRRLSMASPRATGLTA